MNEPDAADGATESETTTLGPTLYLIVTLLAFLSVWVSLAGFALLAILYILPPPAMGPGESCPDRRSSS